MWVFFVRAVQKEQKLAEFWRVMNISRELAKGCTRAEQGSLPGILTLQTRMS